MRENLSTSLRNQFSREIERSLHDINEAISPYTRFIRAERTKLQDTQGRLEKIKTEIVQLKTRIDTL